MFFYVLVLKMKLKILFVTVHHSVCLPYDATMFLKCRLLLHMKGIHATYERKFRLIDPLSSPTHSKQNMSDM